MSVLKLEALDRFAECIRAAVPELLDICPGPADAPARQMWPHLVINPVSFKYFPDQALDWKSVGASSLIVNVGRHEGLIQLRLGATTNYQRAEIEQKIIDLFLATPMHPGIILMDIPACNDARIAWELDGDEWQNERAFDKAWYSVMTVMLQLPALVTRTGAYTIRQLQLGITDKFDEVFSATTFNTSEKIEVVQVNANGTITAL